MENEAMGEEQSIGNEGSVLSQTPDIAKEDKKQKIKDWLKDPHNLIFAGILILAFIIRLYYFVITKNQPMWWDESDYMAYAKNLAGFNVDWTIVPEHNSLFPFLAAGFFKLGFSEVAIKFILEFIPSILLVYLTYKICIIMYNNKKLALVSAFLMTVFWNILFNSVRFHVGVPALLFAFLAIYVFWQGYEKKQKIFGKINPKFAIPITAFFIILTYAIRRGYFLFGLFFLIYMLCTKKISNLLKDKYNWYALVLSAALLFLTETFIFISSINDLSVRYYNKTMPYNLIPFRIFKTYFNSLSNPTLSVLTYLFWLGLAMLIFNLFLTLDYLRKQDSYSSSKADFFNFLSIALTLSFFLFFSRSTVLGDPRWYFPLLLSSFICVSKGAVFIINYIKKYNKILSVIILIILVGYGGYYELQHADFIIKNKVNSFNGIKQSSLYLNKISSQEDIIMSVSEPQTAYYAERKVIYPSVFMEKDHNYNTTIDDLIYNLNTKPEAEIPKYLIITFSEPGHPKWMAMTYQNRIEIPFMETALMFDGRQDIKQTKTHDNIRFDLLIVVDDAFVYQITKI